MPKFLKTREITKTQRIFLSGLIFFVYSLGAGVAIQINIVPKIFPQFDLGEGLIIFDSAIFNQIAKAKADEIKEEGWGAWELSPQAQSPAGIASIFYTIWIPKPYSLLPFNALVHALSGCFVLWLLPHFFSWKPAVFGSALFVINPAAMEWVAQIHRDGVFVLGNLMVLVCIVQLLGGLKSANVRAMAWGLILGVAGTWFVWIARPYWVQVLMVFVLLGLFLISISCWTTRGTRNGMKLPGLLIVLFAIGLLLFQGWLVRYHTNEFAELPRGAAESVAERSVSGESGAERSVSGESGAERSVSGESGVKLWSRSQWIPELVEKKLYRVSSIRRSAVSAGGNSVEDADVVLNSAGAFVAYLPRALQVGLLSPLPKLWWEKASTPAMTMARKVMGVTTFVFYFCLLGLLAGMISYRNNPVGWIIIMFCLLGILVYTYAYPNVGTLLRFRYGFYMLLIAFGAANIAELTFGWLRKRHNH